MRKDTVQHLIVFDPDELEKIVDTRVRAALASVANAPRYEKWWMSRFLELLADCRGNVTEAVEALREEDPRGPSRSTVYRSLETCPHFRRGWKAISPLPENFTRR